MSYLCLSLSNWDRKKPSPILERNTDLFVDIVKARILRHNFYIIY